MVYLNILSNPSIDFQKRSGAQKAAQIKVAHWIEYSWKLIVFVLGGVQPLIAETMAAVTWKKFSQTSKK